MATDRRPLAGAALVKEVCRRIRVARSYWDAHNNRACRGEREKAIALYETLSAADREQVPQALRVWLRYRSESPSATCGRHRGGARGRDPRARIPREGRVLSWPSRGMSAPPGEWRSH